MADLLRNAELLALELVGRGHIYNVVDRDTQTISQAATPIIVAINSGIMLLFTAIYIATLSLPGFLVTVAVLGAALMVHLRMNEEVMRHMQAASARENSFFDALTHLLDGFEVKMSSRRSQDLFGSLRARRRGRGEGRHWSTVRRSLHLFPDCLLHSARRPGLCAAELLRDSSGLGAADHLGHSLYRRTAVELIATVPTMSAANVAVENITSLEARSSRCTSTPGIAESWNSRRSRPSRKSRGRTFASPTGIGTAPKPSKSAQSALRIARTTSCSSWVETAAANRLS